MKALLGLTLLTLSLSSFAKSADPLKFVPGGEVLREKKNEYDIKTPNATVVEVELTSMGNLDEAEGDSIEKDVFTPGEGQKTLAQIAKIIKDQGYTLKGDWNYDSQILGGKVYEVDALKDGKEWELTLDASNGSIIKEEMDD